MTARHRPIPCQPAGDKVTRLSGVSARIERGEVHLPVSAPWLVDFLHELLAFPNGRHDDQADALSQLLTWDLRPQGMTISQAAIDSISRPPWRSYAARLN
jgi:phage terminase large subunit-like protein